MGRKVGGKFKREVPYVHLWLIRVDVLQKPSQYCKAVILQLNIKLKKSTPHHRHSASGNSLPTKPPYIKLMLLIRS